MSAGWLLGARRHLAALEAQLARSGGPWITGAQLSLADVSWPAILERVREADWRRRCSPQVRAYGERLGPGRAMTQP